MSVSVDTAGAGAAPASAAPSWSHTISASASLVLVWITIGNNARSVSALTVGGISASFVTSFNGGAGFPARMELWELIAPPTGAQTISATIPGTGGNLSGDSVSFIGASGIGTPVTGTGTASPASVTVTSVLGDLVVDYVGKNLSGTCASESATPGGSQAQQYALCSDGVFQQNGSTQAGSSSVSMSWTLTGNTNWLQMGVDVLSAVMPPLLGPHSAPNSNPLLRM